MIQRVLTKTIICFRRIQNVKVYGKIAKLGAVSMLYLSNLNVNLDRKTN